MEENKVQKNKLILGLLIIAILIIIVMVFYIYIDKTNSSKNIVLYKGMEINAVIGKQNTKHMEINDASNKKYNTTYYNYENGKYQGESLGTFGEEIYNGVSVVKNVTKIAMTQKYNAIPRKHETINIIPDELSFLKDRDDVIKVQINKIDLDGDGKDEYLCSYAVVYDTNDNRDYYGYKYDLLISHIELFDSNYNKIGSLINLESDSDVYLSLKESVEYIDLDNDGAMEILIEIPGWEWIELEILKYNNKQISGNVDSYHYASWRHGA